MNVQRLWVLGAGLLAAAVLVAGWFLGVSPQLAAAEASQSSIASADQQNARLEAQLARLKRDAGDLPSMQARLASLDASVPGVLGLQAFTRELDAVQHATGAAISSVAYGDVVPYAAAKPAAVPGAASSAPDPSPTASPTSSATPTPSAMPATITGPAAVASGIAPVPASAVAAIGSGAFFLVPVTIAVHGGVDAAFATVEALRTGDRLFVADGITAADTTGDGTSSIQGYVFVLVGPGSGAKTAGSGGVSTIASAGETPEPAQTPSK